MINEQQLSGPAATKAVRVRGRSLVRDALVYGGASVLGRALALFTFPILTRRLGVDQYGALDLASFIAGLFVVALVFGQDSAIARYFYEFTDRNSRRQLISQSLAIQVAVMILLLPIGWAFADLLGQQIFDSDFGGQWFRIILLQIPCMLLVNFSTNVLRWSMRRTQYVAMNIASAIVQAAALSTVAICTIPDVAVVLTIGVAVYATFAIIGLALIREWITWPQGSDMVRRTIGFAWPVGVICVAGALTPVLERVLTERLLGPADLGRFAVAARLAGLLYLAVSAFQSAWGPFALANYRHAEAEAVFQRVYLVGSALGCAIALSLSGCAVPLIRILASAKYEESALAVFPLALAIAMQSTMWIAEIGITIAKRNHLQFLPFTLQIVISVGLLSMMPASAGIVWVGFAVLAGQTVKCVATCRASSRSHPIHWPHLRVTAVYTATIICGVASISLMNRAGALAGGVVALIGAAALLFATWRMALTPFDRHRALLALARTLAVSHRQRSLR